MFIVSLAIHVILGQDITLLGFNFVSTFSSDAEKKRCLVDVHEKSTAHNINFAIKLEVLTLI